MAYLFNTRSQLIFVDKHTLDNQLEPLGLLYVLRHLQ
jgi:hypothetical protein